MKTDRVLTVEEYLNACDAVPMHVDPPAPNARHVPIAAAEDANPVAEAHACRCDRWGHPCPDCLEDKLQTRVAPPDFPSTKQTSSKTWNT